MAGFLSERLSRLPLRARLLLLVTASALPLIGMGAAREYAQYRSEANNVYQSLLTTARGITVAVERDLLLRTTALEALAMSPALRSENQSAFDTEARLFLARQPPSAMLAVVGPDDRIIKAYGAPAGAVGVLHKATGDGDNVFRRGTPVITDLHVGQLSGNLGFTIEVPVFHEGHVVLALFLRLHPSSLQDLLTQQHVPPDRTIAIVDTQGAIVARTPHPEAFVGRSMVPALWALVKTRIEGLTQGRTLEGTPVIVAFTRLPPANWAVAIGAPQALVLAPLRDGILRIALDATILLGLGLVLAAFAARRITEPISRLRQLAESDDPSAAAALHTGLPETDTVARALVTAAADRKAAAEALAESEQRFRALFERSPSGVMLVDPDTWRVIDCNDTAAGFLGLSRGEFLGSSLMDLRLSSSEQRLREISRAVVSGEVMRYEARVRGRAGPRDLFVAVGPIRVAGRTVLLVSQIDVTELRRAEDDLRLNRERLDLAREGANLGIWDWDLVSGEVIWSDHAYALHGLAPSGTGPQLAEIRALIDPADRGAVRAEFRRTLKEPEHRFAAEYTVRPADGRARRLLSRGQAIRDQQGTVLRVVGITLDVTARFEAEKARDRLIGLLQEERGRLSEIIEALPVGVGIVGPSRRFTLSNALMRRYLGPQAPDASSPERACWTGRDAGGNPLPADEYPVAKALRGEATLPGQEFLHTAADGVTTWFRVACLPLRPADGIGGGTIQEVLLVLQNIDAERRLVDLERRANARLEQRVREEVSAREAAQQRAAQAERVQALGQIAGGIAHDFNNVLQAVTGGAALIERRLDQPDRVLRHVRMIADAARRGAAITSRLLAFARRGDLRAEIVDPAALLSDMADVLSHTLGGSVCCQVDAPSGLPPLFADRGQLETVLVNLATNARDAMANGGTLTLSARSETAGYDHVSDTGAPPDLPPGDYVRISVTDTGAGMSPSVLARVSEPFFTTKEPGKGTGLGLAMAKGFVEQSGGRLAIDSTEGKGTTVHLWLPQAPRGASGLAHQKTSTESRSLVPLVLLADDDPIVRTVLADSLEDAGFTVLVAESGQAALDLLRRQPRLDALVTDLTMPGMDGLTLIREVQALRPGLPAVLLTGYAGDGAALAIGGAISGTFSLLRKPVTGVQLVDRITSLLEGSPTPLAH